MLYKIKRIEIVYMDRIYISNNIKSFIYAIQPESIFSFSKMSRKLNTTVKRGCWLLKLTGKEQLFNWTGCCFVGVTRRKNHYALAAKYFVHTNDKEWTKTFSFLFPVFMSSWKPHVVIQVSGVYWSPGGEEYGTLDM